MGISAHIAHPSGHPLHESMQDALEKVAAQLINAVSVGKEYKMAGVTSVVDGVAEVWPFRAGEVQALIVSITDVESVIHTSRLVAFCNAEFKASFLSELHVRFSAYHTVIFSQTSVCLPYNEYIGSRLFRLSMLSKELNIIA